jgi:hypothetical protein
MKKTLDDLDKVQSQINTEWNNYRKAIIENKSLADVRKLYIHIKELEKQIDILMKRANELHSHKGSQS